LPTALREFSCGFFQPEKAHKSVLPWVQFQPEKAHKSVLPWVHFQPEKAHKSVLHSGFFQPEKAHKSLLGHFGYYLEELGQPSDLSTSSTRVQREKG
jgi:hypothetical protein